MLVWIDDGAFFLGIGTPEEKDKMIFFVREKFDDTIGELFPAFFLM